ncbi:glycosyltransferase family 4 protein, partial [Gemmatimonadota bacterium]
MLVTMITPEFPPTCGGIGYYAYYLSRALASRGLQVEMIVRGGKGEGEYQGVNFKRIPTRGLPPLNNGSFSKAVRKNLHRRAPDLLHIHSSSMPLIRGQVPEVVTSHSCIRAITPLFFRPIRDVESL